MRECFEARSSCGGKESPGPDFRRGASPSGADLPANPGAALGRAIAGALFATAIRAARHDKLNPCRHARGVKRNRFLLLTSACIAPPALPGPHTARASPPAPLLATPSRSIPCFTTCLCAPLSPSAASSPVSLLPSPPASAARPGTSLGSSPAAPTARAPLRPPSSPPLSSRGPRPRARPRRRRRRCWTRSARSARVWRPARRCLSLSALASRAGARPTRCGRRSRLRR